MLKGVKLRRQFVLPIRKLLRGLLGIVKRFVHFEDALYYPLKFLHARAVYLRTGSDAIEQELYSCDCHRVPKAIILARRYPHILETDFPSLLY
jgi:hypothetical protein